MPYCDLMLLRLSQGTSANIGEAGNQIDEFSLKGFIVASINEWIETCGAHGHNVTNKKHKMVVFPAIYRKQIQVIEKVNCI